MKIHRNMLPTSLFYHEKFSFHYGEKGRAELIECVVIKVLYGNATHKFGFKVKSLKKYLSNVLKKKKISLKI